MSHEMIMPKLGLTMTHGKITRWLKKEGDRVLVNEAVLEIETDKINSDVESPVDGYILKILAEEGEDKEITTPLCIIGEKDELTDGQNDKIEINAKAPTGVRIFITPVAKMLAKLNGLDYSKLYGTGPQGHIVKKDIVKRLEENGHLADNNLNAVTRETRITPLAKKMAQENGIDFTKVIGTGPDDRIVKEDIQAAVDAGRKLMSSTDAVEVKAVSEALVLKASVIPGTADAVQEPEERFIVKKVPLAGIRKIVAARLTQSKHDIPHVYFKISVDASNMMELKNKVSEAMIARTGRKLSLNDIIVKAVAAAIEEFPDFNASLVENEIIYYKNANIGIAVNSERGLVVPVVRNAGEKSLSELCSNLGELVDKARSGKLSHEDMTGGTFTVSNLGVYHIDEFSAIINPPESAILAVGRAAETPCVRNGEIVIRLVMNLTLSVDHRIIDGALAAQFMKKLKDILEDPYLMLI